MAAGREENSKRLSKLHFELYIRTGIKEYQITLRYARDLYCEYDGVQHNTFECPKRVLLIYAPGMPEICPRYARDREMDK